MAWKNIFKALKKDDPVGLPNPAETSHSFHSPAEPVAKSVPLEYGTSKALPTVKTFILQKEGNSFEECEDSVDFSLERRRFAVSDGATESVFADLWSRGLIQQFLKCEIFPSVANFQDWLKPVQDEWRDQIDWDNLPWFTEQKIEYGAFAAFVGIEFSSKTQLDEGQESLYFKVMAVGDCCLFQIRNNQLIKSFPIQESRLFDNQPDLLCSSSKGNPYLDKQALTFTGSCRQGDSFILASDALACWFLAQWESGELPWETLDFLNEQIDFEVFVMTQRHEGWLKNDDTSLLVLKWDFQRCDGSNDGSNPNSNPLKQGDLQ